MTVIVCLDRSNGMMFNHRRQSRDANVISDILQTASEKTLFMDPYSVPLFSTAERDIGVCEDFLDKAGVDDFCFIENASVAAYKEKITRLIVYKWNRDYPADFFFDIDYAKNFRLVSTVDFEGTSHDRITKEIYVR